MQIMTRQKIAELQKTHNRVLTLDDFDLIAKLDEAADVVVNGVQVADSDTFAYPLLVAGEVFRAPTIGKEMYWKEQVVKYVDDDLIPAAQLWILTFERVPELRGEEIQKAVKKWARKSKLTRKNVDYIHSYYMPDEAQAEQKKEDNSYGELIGLLIREYGKDRDYWMNAEESEIKLVLADLTAQQEARAAEFRKAKGGSRNQVAPAPSPKFVATHNFNKIVAEIKKEWSE